MERAQFMEQLEKLLSDISDAERQEALDYYESYFDDAGPENEAAVIRELGSPGKVAAIIKADLQESNDNYAEYTELGYEDTRAREPGQMPDKYTAVADTAEKKSGERSSSAKYSTDWQNGSETGSFGRTRAGRRQRDRHRQEESGAASYASDTDNPKDTADRAERGYHARRKHNNGAIILVLILLVFLSPFIKGAVGGILGVVLTIALLPFLLIFALGAGALGLIIAAVVCAVTGIALCFSFPASGILTIGVGCLLMALGIIFLVLLVWMAGNLVPKLLQKFTDFCSNLLHNGRKDGVDA